MPRISILVLMTLGAILLVFILPSSFGWRAQDPSTEVREVVAKLSSLRRFRANINIKRDGNTDKDISGVLSYEEGKTHLKLQDGRVVATNGIYMIAYNPTNNVAAKQLVDPAVGGAGWLLEGYDYELSSATEALGTASGPKARFQKVRIQWGEAHLLRRLSTLPRGEDNENWTHLYLFNIRELTSFSPSLFSYRPPTGSRTVENALNRKD